MKRIICYIVTAALILSSSTFAYAKPKQEVKQSSKHQIVQVKKDDKKQDKHQEKGKGKSKKQSFKINGSPVIKYGRYKIPINPITKGMGATLSFDKATGVLTVEKGTIKVVIDLKNRTATINGVADNNSGIFTASNSKKTTVLIKYIAKALGVRVNVDEDTVEVEVPGLDAPTNVAVTPVGTTVVANTLNSSSLYLTATANIIAGQAAGGKAELYVGTKLVAVDNTIDAADSTVTFSTADETPTNAELQAAIPTGGVVTVKLYNASNQVVASKGSNVKLVVDYAPPTITSVTTAVIDVTGAAITLNVTGAGAVGDKVDVSKVTLYDTNFGRTYQLTTTPGTGSYGVVVSPSVIVIYLGSTDKLGLTGFGSTSMFITISAGSFLTDAAGNASIPSTVVQTVPMTVKQ